MEKLSPVLLEIGLHVWFLLGAVIGIVVIYIGYLLITAHLAEKAKKRKADQKQTARPHEPAREPQKPQTETPVIIINAPVFNVPSAYGKHQPESFTPPSAPEPAAGMQAEPIHDTEPETITQSEPEVVAQSEPEVVAQTEPEVVAQSEPNVVAQTEPEVVAQSEPEVVAQSEPETVAQTEPEIVVQSEPEIVAQSEPDVVAQTEPDVVAQSEYEPEPLPEPEVSTQSEPDVVAQSEPDVVAQSEPEVVAQSEPEVVAQTEPEVVAQTEPDVVAQSEPEVVAQTVSEFDAIESEAYWLETEREAVEELLERGKDPLPYLSARLKKEYAAVPRRTNAIAALETLRNELETPPDSPPAPTTALAAQVLSEPSPAQTAGAFTADTPNSEPITDTFGADTADTPDSEPITDTFGTDTADTPDSEPITDTFGADTADTPNSEPITDTIGAESADTADMDSPAIFAAEFEEAGDLGGDVYSAEFGGAGEAWFTLTREDIFDHIADMNGDKLRFPVDAFGVARDKKRGMPASLQCGGRSFGFLYGLTAVKLTLRCPDSLARDLLTRYTGARHAAVPVGWFDFIIDRSVKSKREVFDVLDECYLYTMSLFYGADGAGYTHGNDTAAEAELVDNLALIADSLGSPDPLYAAAVEERRRAAADFAARYPAALGITVERLLRFTRKHLPDADIIERTKWYMPVSLRCGKRTFAIIYPRRAGISLTLRISDEYAAYLIRRHPLVRRARWPRTRNWYIVPLDGTFRHTPEIFRTLQRAHTYLKTGFTR